MIAAINPDPESAGSEIGVLSDASGGPEVGVWSPDFSGSEVGVFSTDLGWSEVGLMSRDVKCSWLGVTTIGKKTESQQHQQRKSLYLHIHKTWLLQYHATQYTHHNTHVARERAYVNNTV